MKPCSKCDEIKPLDDFYKNKTSPDGRRGECKACVLQERAAKYAANPEMRERLKRAARVWQQQNMGAAPTLPRECAVCGSAMRPSRHGASGMCVSCKRLAGYKVNISRADRLAIYERDGWLCQICNRAVEPTLHPNHTFAATLDHIVPRSTALLIDDSPENLRLAHRACNSARGNRAA